MRALTASSRALLPGVFTPQNTAARSLAVRPFAGEVAVVTGASSGIGAATARLLAAGGAAVAVNYHTGQARARDVVAAVEAAGGHAIAVPADVTDPDQVEALMATARAQLGPVSVLVVNAHGIAAQPRIAPFTELDWMDLETPVVSQLKALFHPVKAALPDMLARRHGSIVMVGASLSRHPAPGFLTIAAAKSTVEVAVKAIAREVGPGGVRVNGVGPALVLSAIGQRVPEEQRAAIAQRAALRRNATPEDVAQVIAFLAGTGSGYLTGAYLTVDGGTHMT